MERRTVMRVRDDRADVRAGDDAMHALDGPRGARVDALDAAMRDRAAEDSSVQHSRQAQVVHVLRPARHLRPTFEAGNGLADCCALCGFRGHS
ncbi:hypothetical protein D3C83_40490 [compost metagenome]